MTDEIDAAQEQAAKIESYLLNVRMPTGPEPTGVCLHCSADVSEGHRWCDGDCRDEWEYEARMKARNRE